MTTRHSTLYKPDEQFLAQANDINSKCHLNETAWAIDIDRLNDFDAHLSTANTAYEANSHKSTKNATTSANKKAAFGELKHFMSTFIDYLELNIAVPDAELESMGLRPRHHQDHHPLPRPEEEVVLSIRKHHDEMTVYAARPEQGHPDSSVAPVHYHGFTLRYRMEDEKGYHTSVSTRLHHTLFFEREDEGRRIYISAAWVNPRLEPGPWSDEISEIVG